MFYCTPCADKKKWPKSIFQSYGRCEICAELTSCNDVPSNKLPFIGDTGDPLSGGFAIMGDSISMQGYNKSVDFKTVCKMFDEPKKKPNWLSIKRANKCLFSRRHGHMGKLFLGYSICLRLFGKTIL